MKSSRRSLLKAGAAGALSLAAFPARAQEMLAQVEWTEGFDASAPTEQAAQSSRPSLSNQSPFFTEQAIANYTQIASQGGWPTVPTDQTLKVGSEGASVSTLRQRLMITGDLAQTAGDATAFDSFVDAAVRRFQARHGIIPDGVAGGDTLRQMNVPVDMRIQQLQLNLVRLNALPNPMGDRHVMVNVPGAEIETVEGDTVHSRHRGIVGKIDRQTPLLNSKIVLIKFNPYWTVPKSIILKDLIPKMQKDPGYLDRQKIHIYDERAKAEIGWQQINWNSSDAVNYTFRQDPGDLNSMGTVKIEFPSPEGVYMHDTPAKGLFGGNDRFHSSGCVRVQNVREYVYWILENTPDWPKDRITEALTSGERIDAPVADPVPLFFQYITAWATPDNGVQFRDDIYQRDGLGVPQTAQAL
ncbi:L,D-transpeptidase family protein [Oryzibacter oryziterrae]|uniref:L,D-transpeptidase family protein n=1 Tax=Oryzibacter oryziterrae TaxID=2766474 RepID=UPI001F002AD9|nr:L,D-transpeptidase family protein [Oryzibacter oryziterrae]